MIFILYFIIICINSISNYFVHKLRKVLIKNAVTKREINKFAFNFSKKIIQPAFYRLPTKVC